MHIKTTSNLWVKEVHPEREQIFQMHSTKTIEMNNRREIIISVTKTIALQMQIEKAQELLKVLIILEMVHTVLTDRKSNLQMMEHSRKTMFPMKIWNRVWQEMKAIVPIMVAHRK